MHQPRVSGASHDAARPRRPPGRRPERHRRLVRPGGRPGRGYANLRYAEPDRVRPSWPAGPTVLLPGDRLRWSPDPPCAQGRGRGDRPTWPRVRHRLRRRDPPRASTVAGVRTGLLRGLHPRPSRKQPRTQVPRLNRTANSPGHDGGTRIMTTISIIGSGNMAAAIGTRAAKHGHTVELMSRNTPKAQALADQIGNGATVGTFGARPAGDIVVVAVLHAGAVDVVAHYGDALAGKILVDITNSFNADASGLVTSPGNSVSQQIATVAPEGAHVVKAFNSIFGGVLAEEKRLDAFFAGDSAEAKARVAAFLESLDMRPLDAGALEMAYALEWAGILLVGLARNGADFDIALGADVH